MVKRQTVWLSTMMVLSLMLIGYYTMNNQASPASTTATNASSQTLTTTPVESNGTDANSANSTANSSSTNSESGQMSSSDNWYNELQSQIDNTISQKISNYQAVIANNNASAEQITAAEKELGKETTLYNGLQQATAAVVAEGYKNAVIEPDNSQTTFTVYVQAKSLSPADAVKVMNVVSQDRKSVV